MDGVDLDEIDKKLLGELQADARQTAVELGEAIGVSDNTVHNRMERLAEAGVITGYTANIDPDSAGLDLRFLFTATVRISDRADRAAEIMEIPEVTEVTELMTGQENLLIEAVGAQDEDITRVASAIDEMGIEINDEKLIRDRHRKPLDFEALVLRSEDA